MIYKVCIAIDFLIDERSGYKPDINDLTRDLFDGIRGKDESLGLSTIKRDAKIIYCDITSEKVI